MAGKKKQELSTINQNLKFLGFLTLGLTLSFFLIVSGLASLYPQVKKAALESQIPFILVGEPKEVKKPQPLTTLYSQESVKLENSEQVRVRIFSTREKDLKIADLNNDGVVNIVDFLLAKKIISIDSESSSE